MCFFPSGAAELCLVTPFTRDESQSASMRVILTCGVSKTHPRRGRSLLEQPAAFSWKGGQPMCTKKIQDTPATGSRGVCQKASKALLSSGYRRRPRSPDSSGRCRISSICLRICFPLLALKGVYCSGNQRLDPWGTPFV